MEQSYKEKYEDILARLERAKNDDEVCDERFCCVINDLIPELAESEDEKIRKEIINYFQCQSEEEPTRKEIHDKWIAWLEKQGEQKPAWSEENSFRTETLISVIKSGGSIRPELRNEFVNWLQSLKDRVQPKQEWSEEEIEPIISDYLCGREHYGGMIGRLCHLKPKQKQTEWNEDDKAFLDDILCKLEHDLILNKDEKDWLKSLRPQNRWKPSDVQIECLSDAIEHYNSLGYPASKLKELLDDLKKLNGGEI